MTSRQKEQKYPIDADTSSIKHLTWVLGDGLRWGFLLKTIAFLSLLGLAWGEPSAPSPDHQPRKGLGEEPSAQGESSNNVSVIYRGGQLVELEPHSIGQITVPIVYENGILFTYSGKDSDEVYVSGEFWGWGKRKKLAKNIYGIYYTFVPLEIAQGTYSYRYIVNDIWINDPQQKYFVEDGYGTKMSALVLDKGLSLYIRSPKYLGNNKFEFFLKDGGFKKVSLVGTRNNWDPFVEPMVLKNGYWILTLKMHRKKTFYRYWVDGETRLDPNNPHVAKRKHDEDVNFIPKW